jgi:Glycosyl transferase family 2/Glycosyl transferases group 1
MMRHEDFIAHYRLPVAIPGAPRPALEWSRRGEGRVRALAGQVRRNVHGRRLAYIDSHFPWQRSGFRYADALALHDARPDTAFFSMYEMRDSFPAPVLPLAHFPRLAPWLGITDVYGVFLGFMAGILGLRRASGREPDVIEGLDLSGFLQREGMRAHVRLDPGGGFVATEAGFADARRLVAAADNVFSWAPAVLENVPGVVPIDPAVVDTAFYAKTPRDFAARPLELLFVADSKPRKGLGVALGALAKLSGDSVHLHVVGPHDPNASPVPASRTTYHGWLEREELRALHRRCHVFVSPVTAERPDDPAGDRGVTDTFPTVAAAEGVSSGLLLLTANPDRDRRRLRPGIDLIELPATAEAFADAVRAVMRDPRTAAAVAESGARRVRERLDVRIGAAARLELMGFTPGRTGFTAPPGRQRRALASRGASTREGEIAHRAAVVAMAAEITALRASLREIQADQRQLAEEIRADQRQLAEETRSGQQRLAEKVSSMRRDLMAVGQLALDDESGARHALEAARSASDYEPPFIESDPLITVCIPTYTNYVQLLERSIPSILAQDHTNIEVVVVGDAAPSETAAGIAGLNDRRVRYVNLTARGPYPDDTRARWLVAGTGPLNHALELARGGWVAINNDDDALRPNHLSTLLAQAQESRDEVVYGRSMQHAPDGSTEIHGVFPPISHGFGWQLALQHRAMRMFEFKLSAALFDEPGDWDRARRMLRAGVRFRMVDEVVCDYYPSKLWVAE